jgi:hypothetical protein
MAVNKGVIVWRGDFGRPETHYAKSIIRDVTSDAALETLITSLLSHTDCNSAKRSFNTVNEMTDSAPGADANVDRRAVYYFRDEDLTIKKLELPAPPAIDTENQGQGERVTAAALAAVVAAVNTATGKTYTGLYGKVIQRT